MSSTPSTKPSNPCSTPIQALFSSSATTSAPATTPDMTAARLVNIVTHSVNPRDTLWRLWESFFIAVITNGPPHTTPIALLTVLRAQRPTQLDNVSLDPDTQRDLQTLVIIDGKLQWSSLPYFGVAWRSTHDTLFARRDLEDMPRWIAEKQTIASGPNSSISGGRCYLRFCTFSAALLKATDGRGSVSPIWVFIMCKTVLECTQPESRPAQPHKISSEQLWALDVHVTAVWIRDGARALWKANQEEFMEVWGRALTAKTDLWPSEDGLKRERWEMWQARLQALSIEQEMFDKETIMVVTEAAEVIRCMLEERTA